MQLDSKRTFTTWKTLKACLLDTSRFASTIGWLPLNVDDKSDRPFAHLLIYPSAWLPFSSHRASPPPLHWYITFNWIPTMKFHPWHCSLFLCPFFPHCIKSRDHFAAILSRRLSLNSPHPNVSLFAYASITQRLFRQYPRTFMHTHRTFWIKRSWTKSWTKKTRHVVSELGTRNNSHFTW